MSNIIDREQNRVHQSHMADDCVWAAICYLDSPTDFREYLQEECVPESSLLAREPLILLDDDAPNHLGRTSFTWFLVGSILLLTLVILVLRG